MAGRLVTVPFCLGESWQVHVACHTIHVSGLSLHVGDTNISTLLKLDKVSYHHSSGICFALFVLGGREGRGREEGGRERGREGEREREREREREKEIRKRRVREKERKGKRKEEGGGSHPSLSVWLWSGLFFVLYCLRWFSLSLPLIPTRL